MFRKLIAAIRSRDPLAQLIADFDQMLADGHWMFQQAVSVVDRKADAKDVADALYRRDRGINDRERQIRMGVLSRLALGDATLLPPCLILMSVVKDAERIGDYCKNLFEVGQYYRGPWDVPQFEDPLKQIRLQVEPLFDKTRKAFAEGSKTAAHEVIETAVAAGQKCELLLQQLLRGVQMPEGEAVAYALISRYYKRVALHLSNISTAVVAPVHNLDYGDEKDVPATGDEV